MLHELNIVACIYSHTCLHMFLHLYMYVFLYVWKYTLHIIYIIYIIVCRLFLLSASAIRDKASYRDKRCIRSDMHSYDTVDSLWIKENSSYITLMRFIFILCWFIVILSCVYYCFVAMWFFSEFFFVILEGYFNKSRNKIWFINTRYVKTNDPLPDWMEFECSKCLGSWRNWVIWD